MNKKVIFIFLGIILSSSFCFAAETVTITTYYPAPYGVYQQLRLYPVSNGASGIGQACTNEGEMYYDDDDNQFLYCSTGLTLQPITGGYWSYVNRASADEVIHPTDLNTVVGIGTSTPGQYNAGIAPRVRLHIEDPNSLITNDDMAFCHYVSGSGPICTSAVIEGRSAAVLQIASEYDSKWMSHIVLSGIDNDPSDGRLNSYWWISAWGPDYNMDNHFGIGRRTGSSRIFDPGNPQPGALPDWAEYLYITKDGEVGINKNPPDAGKKLHVGGDAKIDGTLDIGWEEKNTLSPTVTIAPNPGDTVEATATCSAGKTPISGGCDCGTSGSEDISMRESYATATGWYCQCYAPASAVSINVRAYAYCARVKK